MMNAEIQAAVEQSGDFQGECAYVALLHGSRHHFLMYALLLGHQLLKLNPNTPRVLLVGRSLSDYWSPWLEGFEGNWLRALWQVEPVHLVDAAAADKTSSKRHRFVFTKLRALELPYRKLVFFDLDIVIRQNPVQLFQVQAPAGMFHGEWWYRMSARHGQELSAEGFISGCINAGVMRLDTLASSQAREQLVQDLLRDVNQIDFCSYLPEQYYLVNKLTGWHHIDVMWNCEVSPAYYIDRPNDAPDGDFKVHEVQMPIDWWRLGQTEDELSLSVGIWHFSGTYLEPWWFMHLRADEAQALLRASWQARDSRGMIALAIRDWLQSLEEFRSERMLLFVGEDATVLDAWLADVTEATRFWWDACAETCKRCMVNVLDCRFGCEECAVRDHNANSMK